MMIDERAAPTRSRKSSTPPIRVSVLGLVTFSLLCAAPWAGWSQDSSVVSLEQLMDTQVTTVSRIPEKRSRVPAAVHVITQEDIRRAGVTSIPDALRLAPGVHVARIDANKWSIGIRGFGSRLSRSMLVLIDGRAVYSPLFAGTYWEVQDTLLEDIDRIEVIRGPGGILWGANAVNGIVNIITKEARNTQGLLVTTGAGSEEQGFVGLRYGASAGQNLQYRFYGKFFNRDAAFHQDGNNYDGWKMGRTGFRSDWTLSEDRTFTFQGDLYLGRSGQRSPVITYEPPFRQLVEDDAKLSGANVLGRWSGAIGGISGVTFQFYYDRTNRTETTFEEKRDTVDFDFQHSLRPMYRQEITWGASYRVSSGDVASAPTLQLTPNRRTDQLLSSFLQDEVALIAERLYLIAGSKFEHNGYSGFEWQPNGKVLWTPSPNHTVRLSATRAVRTPSRVEEDMELTTLLQPTSPATFLRLIPNDDFQSEKLHSYELGYRIRPVSSLYVNVSTFFNDHDDLVSSEVGTPFFETSPEPPHTVLPLQWQNLLQGNSYGSELVVDSRAASWWRLNGSYSYLRINLRRDANSLDRSSERSLEGGSPRHQVALLSSMNWPAGLEFDWMFRYVSELASQSIPDYATSDVRLGWRPYRYAELSVVGQNLHQPRHPEFSGGVQVERSVYGKATWRW